MTFTEGTVIIVGGAVGYWIVSELIARLGSHKAERTSSSGETGNRSNDAKQPVWCAVLEVGVDASLEEIRRSYRALMSQYHPDKVALLGKELRDLAECKSKAINSAYRDALRWHGVEH
jgi:DnaJ like chaperone protein